MITILVITAIIVGLLATFFWRVGVAHDHDPYWLSEQEKKSQEEAEYWRKHKLNNTKQ